METKPLKPEVHLALENMSLKLHIAKRNCQDLETRFMSAAEQVLKSAGLSKEEWALDLDRGLFVQKEKTAAASTDGAGI